MTTLTLACRAIQWIAIGCTFGMALYLQFDSFADARSSLLSLARETSTKAGDSACPSDGPIKKVDPGWDAVGRKLYGDKVISLSSTGVTNTTVYVPPPVYPPELRAVVGPGFFVSKDVSVNEDFWAKLANGDWERGTFNIFLKYINPNTTVVDFGTWIGPTLLYHGRYSRRSFGIEADPVAFAIVEYNVGLNRKLNPGWGSRVTVDSGCISRPEDVGTMTMKAAGQPGQSVSGINNKVAGGASSVKWEVQCHTLPVIFENYWGIHRPYEDVFIKIDIESYECKLVPSFYDWLREERYLPKMYISFHPQIEPCSDEEFEGVLRFLRLYDHVRVRTNQEELRITNATTVEDLKGKLGDDVVVYQDHHSIDLSDQFLRRQ